jgi:coiled-coil domain-containing protein 77
MDDRRVREDEAAARLAQEVEKTAAVTAKLQHAQTLLYDSTRDFLDLKYEQR